jgi:hypothetical protein
MSTLFVNTIYPDSGSIVNISGSLKISQSLIVADNIIMSGSIKLGDTTADSVSLTAEISSSIIPDATITYNLGSSVKTWNKLHIANITSSGNISSSGIVYGRIGKFDELELAAFTSITASGGISASVFRGDGSQLTGVGITGSALDVVSINVDTFVSGAGTGSFNHFFVSGEISGSVSASGTGSFQGGVNSTGASGSFGYILATGDISTSGQGLFGGGINTTGQTGSFGYISASGDISSSGTGSFEHLIVTSQINSNISASGTGSFMGGVDSINATGSFGYISSSGDISSSGTGSFEHFMISSQINSNISASGTGSFNGGIDCIGDGTGMAAATGAFGYVSTSGDLTVNDITTLGATGDITTVGTASFGHVIINAGSENHSISASGDIRLNTGSFFVGDGRLLTNITSSAAVGGANTQVLFNDGGSVGGDAGITYNKSGLGILSISGSIIVGNNTPGLGHVSASRVSASLGFEADTLSTSSFGFISCSGDISSSGTGSFEGGINCISPGGDDVDGTGSFGYISCSGDISMSGTFAAGAISSSGTISGSLLKGQSVQAQVGNNLGYRFNLNDDSQINGVQYNVIGERAHLQIPSLPVSVTLPFSASATALVGGNLTVGGTTTIAGVTTTNGTLNAASGFQIGGVAVTATAAELNKMDAFLGTTAQLNRLIKTNSTSIEAGKSVNYDSGGAISSKIVIIEESAELTIGNSGAFLIPVSGEAQTFTLPNAEESTGVYFRFIVGRAARHIILSPTNKIQGIITSYTNGTTVERTNIANMGRLTIGEVPKIGDNLTLVCNGDNWYVTGETNSPLGIAQV